MIVKIQSSLFPPGAGTMLIYDREQTVEGILPLSKDVEKPLFGDPKYYFEATVDDEGLLRIKKRVADQDWQEAI